MSESNGNNGNAIEIIKQHIGEYPNFPKPGILFKDIFSVLQKPEVFVLLCDVLVDHVKSLQQKVECVAALESRGFLIGPIIALRLQVPFAPIRKKGKLPGKIKSVTYALEYGTDVLEIQETAVTSGMHVLLVDDLLATGGSLSAAAKLIESLSAKIVESLVVIELIDLKGREVLNHPIHSLIQY